MGRIIFSVGSDICAECSLALKRSLGSIKGVKSMVIARRDIIIDFDTLETTEDEITGIAKNCIEKLGYKLLDINVFE